MACTVDSNHSGFTGSGFTNANNATGSVSTTVSLNAGRNKIRLEATTSGGLAE